MNPTVKIWEFVLAIVVLPVTVFAVVKWYEARFSRLPVLGPAGHLVSHNQLKGLQLDNDITIVNFFFTHCPVVCPKMMKELRKVTNASGDGISVYSITVDPLRDDSVALAKYADRLQAKECWRFITGNKKDIYRFARKEVFVVAADGDGGEDDFIHSDNLVLIDPEKRIRGYYKGTEPSETERMILDIKKLKNEFSIK